MTLFSIAMLLIGTAVTVALWGAVYAIFRDVSLVAGVISAIGVLGLTVLFIDIINRTIGFGL